MLIYRILAILLNNLLKICLGTFQGFFLFILDFIYYISYNFLLNIKKGELVNAKGEVIGIATPPTKLIDTVKDTLKVNLGIEVTTVSPVAIIEGSETLVGKTVTKIKKEARFNDDGNIDYIPYIPANGFRGVLRRYATKRLIDAVKANTDDK